MKRLALSAIFSLAFWGCLSPRAFPCNTNEDCGPGGFCEGDTNLCSFDDAACASGRRYGELAGTLANACTAATTARPLRNACVAGEPFPEVQPGCPELVCAELPACCATLWSEACVRIADQVCPDVHCGEWLATAGDGSTQLFAWDGEFAARGQPIDNDHQRIFWADARATLPRLAATNNRGLEIWKNTSATEPVFAFHSGRVFPAGTVPTIAGVDFDGDEEVELAVGCAGGTIPCGVYEQAATLLAFSTELPIADANAMAWADVAGDERPDVAIATDAGYAVLFQSGEMFLPATLDAAVPGPYRAVGWGDVDGDRQIDLVAIGFGITVHRTIDHVILAPSVLERGPGSLLTGAVGDLDGDHRADIVVATHVDALPGGEQGVVVLSQFDSTSADPMNAIQQSALTPAARMSTLTLADVDDDGRLDVIGMAPGVGVIVIFNSSTPGNIVLAAPEILPNTDLATWLAVTGWPQ